MSVAVGTTTAQTPLTANFGGLKSQVAAYVQGANLPGVLSDAGIGINAGIDRLNTRVWNWLNREVTITLTADTRTYTIPAAFKKPRKLERRDTNSKTVGDFAFQIPKSFADTNWDNTASGTPTHYTVRNASNDRLLTFNVPPSTAFVASWPTARMQYYSRMGHFADGNDTLGNLGVPPELRNFLVWYARWELASMRGTTGQVRDAKEAWQTEWVSLMKDDRNEQTDWQPGERYR